MARIVYGALVETISGSIGGTTFQRNAYGFTVKKKPNVVNKRRPTQLRSRSLISDVSRAWQNLTQVQRDSWDAYAVAFPRPSKNNVESNLNGFNYFQAVHNYRFLGSRPVLPTPSSTQSFDGFLEVELIKNGATFNLIIDESGQTGTWYSFVFLSFPIAQTVNFVKPRNRFMLATLVYNLEIDITGIYEGVFGITPALGNYLGVKLVMINDANGQINTYQIGSQEVTA